MGSIFMSPKKIILQQKKASVKPVELWLKQADIPFSKRKDLDYRRRSAWEKYLSLPIPNRMDESWRRVDLTKLPIEAINRAHASGKMNKTITTIEFPGELQSEGIILDNLLDAEKCYPERVVKAHDQLLSPSRDKFAALAIAAADSGVFISISKNLQLDQPIRVTLSNTGDALGLFQHLVWVEADTKTTLVLDHRKMAAATNSQINIGIIGIHVGENAKLTVMELQPEGQNTWNILYERAQVEKDGALEWIVCSTGSRYTKDFLQIDLTQPGASVNLTGFYLTSEDQQVEIETMQNHLSQNTTSDLMMKGVLLDESKTLFKGMIYVAPEAMKTDGYQVNRNLILGSKAHADSLPGLEILADDVRCSHGATIGKIDPEQLFYLQSRGMDNREARQLIVQGFLDPILQRIPLDSERSQMENHIESKMASHK